MVIMKFNISVWKLDDTNGKVEFPNDVQFIFERDATEIAQRLLRQRIARKHPKSSQSTPEREDSRRYQWNPSLRNRIRDKHNEANNNQRPT